MSEGTGESCEDIAFGCSVFVVSLNMQEALQVDKVEKRMK
jgi:hypothetical protein